MAKSLEETLKDLRAGGYSEGSVRNWLVNKGFPAAKVDKAMALRAVKDAADSRRARLHRALDCVLDRSAAVRGRDELDDKQFLDLMERVGVLRDSTRSLQWPGNDNPRVQKASTDTYNATMSKVKQLIASSGVSPQEFRKRATKVASKVGRRINLNWIDSLDRH
jgi:hypothetical protein